MANPDQVIALASDTLTLTEQRTLSDRRGSPVGPGTEITFVEASFVLRRRIGATIPQFAKIAGVSPADLEAMEYGSMPADQLRAFWSRA